MAHIPVTRTLGLEGYILLDDKFFRTHWEAPIMTLLVGMVVI